jgi:hypothetical protein
VDTPLVGTLPGAASLPSNLSEKAFWSAAKELEHVNTQSEAMTKACRIQKTSMRRATGAATASFLRN